MILLPFPYGTRAPALALVLKIQRLADGPRLTAAQQVTVNQIKTKCICGLIRRGHDFTFSTSHRGPSVLDVNALRIRPQSTRALYLKALTAPIPIG
jgi:hypothetical protein